MNWIKWVIISLAIAVIVGGGGYTVYYLAYTWGDTAGYGRGYATGQEVGYSAGEQEGYISGKDDGYREGYDIGYDEGTAWGYDQGYYEGREEGFGHGYTLRDPTYEEAVTFIEEDKTSDNEYNDDDYGVYVCSHFSRDVCNNAEAAGLRCAIVHLVFPDGMGHAIVAFDTIDEGLAYFEPITDERAEPEIGKHYYKCIEAPPGYYYLPSAHDDTIMDILVTW